MTHHRVDEDLARLQRIQDARRAGIDTERDMCVHGYVQGIGCARCTRDSRKVEAVAYTFALLWWLFLLTSHAPAGAYLAWLLAPLAVFWVLRGASALLRKREQKRGGR